MEHAQLLCLDFESSLRNEPMGNVESTSDETREELGAKIYEEVRKLYPDRADKITGMMLEAGHKELQDLLHKRHVLQERIRTAAVALNAREDIGRLPDLQTLGDRIFGTAQQLYPAIAENVTGMLLEMGQEELCKLLEDNNTLIQCIHTAAHALMEIKLQGIQPGDNGCTEQVANHGNLVGNACTDIPSLDKQRQMIGEEIYGKLMDQYPNHADKITGMLLEIDLESLQEITQSAELLQEKSKEALAALEKVHVLEPDTNRRIGNKTTPNVKSGKTPFFSQTEIEAVMSAIYEEKSTELLGEIIHGNIVKVHPNDADSIVGMLLEMDRQDLMELIMDSEMYNEKVKEAVQALRSTDTKHAPKTPVIRELDDSHKAQLFTPEQKTKHGLLTELRNNVL